METAVTFKDWTIFAAIRAGGPTASTTWNPEKKRINKYIRQNNNDNDNDINFNNDNDNINDTGNDNDNNYVNDYSDSDIESKRTDRNLSLGRIDKKKKQKKKEEEEEKKSKTKHKTYKLHMTWGTGYEFADSCNTA